MNNMYRMQDWMEEKILTIQQHEQIIQFRLRHINIEKIVNQIFILNVNTIEEANALLASDPTIREKVLEAEVFKWYGSAALPTYLPNHEKIEKKKMWSKSIAWGFVQ